MPRSSWPDEHKRSTLGRTGHRVGCRTASVHIRILYVASSPGHSQFLMIHAKNGKAWPVREVTCTSFRWKGGGSRVIIVRGPVTCLRVVLAVPIGHSAVPGTGIATDRRVAIAALQ